MEILNAQDEMWLTDGETFSKQVFIGRTGNATDWREVTEAEKEKIEREKLPIEGAEE